MGGAGWLSRLVYVQKVQVTLEKTGSSVLGMDARKKGLASLSLRMGTCKMYKGVHVSVGLHVKCTGELVSPCIRRVTCKMYR
jgi:hypothetical protein